MARHWCSLSPNSCNTRLPVSSSLKLVYIYQSERERERERGEGGSVYCAVDPLPTRVHAFTVAISKNDHTLCLCKKTCLTSIDTLAIANNTGICVYRRLDGLIEKLIISLLATDDGEQSGESSSAGVTRDYHCPVCRETKKLTSIGILKHKRMHAQQQQRTEQ